MTEPPLYYSVAEIAEQLIVSKMTVYRLVNTGELGSVRIGRSVRVPAEELRRYLEANTTKRA